ncbi:5-hydroxytryptamine receptor [Lingula anatina]|uniref:5-hydroxytryptamine receptor n=1 Tax=Lingula anatina TaxID=7574 RepID=A0A1S3IJF9_LINAN|nr:5-hydroxytryptamine receptor [Lingula anatina]XP_013398243.1 5-hydroxytryptamine receptor [Lingula anatina]XP_013398244.1 5-hydroxytryptamine receptor [Lingula anatina]XP_013398245.1 5-hydroxytryptamine receptor [Lingula anatina]XP_013398246.1 5-hydroxytryptamine receptor [Lingula anatina]XP_013398247.1 5-hydroxytryptamine receptor [Lingula anatina]XP_013398248.1 5-hydroxytryptamine receptor [Lingula anatina]XP_013398249.1 5-hydroxytryptamine receptor [Lingula anatina]XP_013398250.1 5-hy|eukprot:XP_013398242.1 5-hydroxytryptamine receptor [Lingula anatina]
MVDLPWGHVYVNASQERGTSPAVSGLGGTDTSTAVWVYPPGHEASLEAKFDAAYHNQSNNTHSLGPIYNSLEHLIVTSVILGIFILATIIGNCFVIAAIVLEKHLQSAANYLIASLAVADLFVAALVLPLSAVNEVSTHWHLGSELCDMWISIDVLCCTASILHLVAIALDRYWAVTDVNYIHQRKPRRMVIMIAVIWVFSASICFPPLFGWKDNKNDPSVTGLCIISQDWWYTVYSTGLAFYLPLIVILVIYAKVFKAAKSRIRRRQFQAPVTSNGLNGQKPEEVSTLLTPYGARSSSKHRE